MLSIEQLKRASQAFRISPLGHDDQDLYVPLDDVRGDDPVVSRLSKTIHLETGPSCQILTGHVGTGKSTELMHLARVLEDEQKLYVVFCNTADWMGSLDVDFPDLVVGILYYLFQNTERDLRVTLESRQLSGIFQRLVAFSGSAKLDSLKLNTGLIDLSAQMKASSHVRERVRELLSNEAPHFMDGANELILDAVSKIKQHGYQGLAILVDGLEKMSLHRCRQVDSSLHVIYAAKA